MKVLRRWWAVVAVLFVVAIVTAALARERVRTPDGYTFTVAAGEDPAALKLTFPAATLIEIDRDGRLVIVVGDYDATRPLIVSAR